MDQPASQHTMKVRHQALIWGLAGLLLSIAVFAKWPELDDQITQLFYDPALPGFPAKRLTWVLRIYTLAPMVNQLLFLGSLLILLAAWLKPQRINNTWRHRSLAWVLMVVLGLGFTVDWALKDHVGRPRPEQSQAYGGTLANRPVFEFNQGCEMNCSFVSGHAAGGFALMTWGMWASRRKRQQWLAVGVVVGASIGAIRIAQGGHFLSDVVFAGWTIWLVYQLIRITWLHWRWHRMQKIHS